MESAKSPITDSDSGQSPSFWLMMGIFLGLLSLAVIGSFINNLRAGAASVNWATTQGTVLRSELEFDGDFYGAGITYEYNIAGRPYQGTHVHVSDVHFGDGKSEAEAAVDRYRPRAAVLVYYDPDRPGRAVLEPGPNWEDSGSLLIAAFVGYLAWGAIQNWMTRRNLDR
jgi:hypothetical protein